MLDCCRCLLTRWALFALLLVAAPALPGCSKPKFYTVRGQVLFSDTFKPLTEGEVRFRPASDPNLIATGKIGPDGKFSLSTPGHEEGVLEGLCQGMVVVGPRNGKPVIEERFGSFDTADIKITVAPRDENYFILNVVRAKK